MRSVVKPSNGWLESFDAFAAEFYARHDVPGGAVAIVKDGARVYERTFGCRDRERRLAVEPDTLFGIASLTKSFTALTLLALEARGVLNLHDPVLRHLPGFTYPGLGARGPVRLWHLASHTSGLPPLRGLDYAIQPSQQGDPAAEFNDRDYTNAPSVNDYPALLAYLAQGERVGLAGPGSVVSYSNEGFAVLGAVIEAVTGESYPAVVAREVLVPLGLGGAGFLTDELRATGRLTELYTSSPTGQVIHSPNWEEAPAYLATGFMKASVRDLAAYLQYLLWPEDGRLAVGAAGLGELFAPRAWAEHRTAYGLGWMLRDGFNGHSLWRHGGSLKGVSSHQGGVPDFGLGIAVLANLDEVPVKRLWYAAVNAYLGLPLEQAAFEVRSTDLGPEAANELGGVYSSGEPWGRLELVADGNRLLALVGEHAMPNGHLALLPEGEFVLVGGDGAWESGRFVYGAGGARPVAVQYGMRWYDKQPLEAPRAGS